VNCERPVRDFQSGSNDAVECRPGKPWSLWDMLRIYAQDYIELGARTEAARIVFIVNENQGGVPQQEFSEEAKTGLKGDLEAMLRHCKQLDLPISVELISRRIDDLPGTRREFEVLLETLNTEIKSKLFLFVPQHRAKYYELVLQSTITNAFPTASKEIVAAGNCLAAGFYTAAVFHSMRAAEIGMRVLGHELGVSFPDKPLELAEWQNILDQADSKIVAMKSLPRGTHKDEELKFYSQAAVQFRYFKDAWRVHVAHARETYEESLALKVFNHTVEFFDTLATRLKEPKPSF
jgi:hypothetical protein